MEILQQLQHIDWQELLQVMMDWPYFWPTVVSILVLLIIWGRIRKKYRSIHLFGGPTGSVTVAKRALVELIERTCDDIAPGGKARVSLKKCRDKLNIKVRLRLFSGQHLENLASKIQATLTDELKENLGFENVGSINILVTDFKSAMKKDSSPTPSEIDLENND